MLGLEHFVFDDSNEVLDKKSPTSNSNHQIKTEQEDETKEFFKHISKVVDSSTKSLIFANSRADVEKVIHNLRRIAGVERADEDSYYVHHGNIATALREQAETDMRDPLKKTCIAATLTLELGIDIGHLDQVLQIDPTSTVSSFVQRLGRSGRRGGPARMFVYSREDKSNENAHIGRRIPWKLLQMISIIQLYMEEKWIEPPNIPKLPLSLLYHQTLSVLKSQTEMSPRRLAESILTLSPFKNVSADQYRDFLLHLINIEHLEVMDDGKLIVGVKSERLVNNYHFYATFRDEINFTVREKQDDIEIGSIQYLPNIGDRIRLAGRAWQVADIDEDRLLIEVVRVTGNAETKWTGGGITIHARVIDRLRKVLEETKDYGYLLTSAKKRLETARLLAIESGVVNQSVVYLGGNQYMLLPWTGTVEFNTIELLLQHAGVDMGISYRPFYLIVKAQSYGDLTSKIRKVTINPPSAETLIRPIPRVYFNQNKFDKFVPEQLLRKAFSTDELDLDRAIFALESII